MTHEDRMYASRPGQVVSLDTFYVGRLKGVGAVWQLTAVDATTGERQATIPLPVPAAEVQIIYLPDSAHLLVAVSEGSTWTVGTRWQSWVTRACTIAGRNLTREEWQEYYPQRSYEATCPEWPTNR